MVTLVNHGGQCCGARHLYSFFTADEVDPRRIARALSEVPHGRMVEVILNQRQVETSPQTLGMLKNLGFVLTDVYINHNHGPDRRNYRFSRCSDRKPLSEARRWWGGMVASIEAYGQMPESMPRDFSGGTALVINSRGYDGQGIPIGPGLIGARYQVTSPQSEYYRKYVTLREFMTPVRDYVSVNQYGPREEENTFVRNARITTLTYRPPNPQEVAPEVVLAPYVHTGAAFLTPADQVVAPAIVAPIEAPRAPQVVYRTYHNVLRVGVSPAGWPTYQEATRAAPRARGVNRKDIYSDGTFRWVERVEQ